MDVSWWQTVRLNSPEKDIDWMQLLPRSTMCLVPVLRSNADGSSHSAGPDFFDLRVEHQNNMRVVPPLDLRKASQPRMTQNWFKRCYEEQAESSPNTDSPQDTDSSDSGSLTRRSGSLTQRSDISSNCIGPIVPARQRAERGARAVLEYVMGMPVGCQRFFTQTDASRGRSPELVEPNRDSVDDSFIHATDSQLAELLLSTSEQIESEPWGQESDRPSRALRDSRFTDEFRFVSDCEQENLTPEKEQWRSPLIPKIGLTEMKSPPPDLVRRRLAAVGRSRAVGYVTYEHRGTEGELFEVEEPPSGYREVAWSGKSKSMMMRRKGGWC